MFTSGLGNHPPQNQRDRGIEYQNVWVMNEVFLYPRRDKGIEIIARHLNREASQIVSIYMTSIKRSMHSSYRPSDHSQYGLVFRLK